MDSKRQHKVVSALLERHGRTYCQEIGIRLRDTPAPLFQLLVASILFSARIGAEQAVEAARGLRKAGLTTVKKMGDATWEKRVRILNENGYARYDESTSRMLGETCELLGEKYRGDLRRLREEADRDAGQEQQLLTQFKGMGPAGAAIFLREVQAIWPEAHPFLDDRARKAASDLGLPTSADALASLVKGPEEMARLVAALVRTSLAHDRDEICAAAEL